MRQHDVSRVRTRISRTSASWCWPSTRMWTMCGQSAEGDRTKKIFPQGPKTASRAIGSNLTIFDSLGRLTFGKTSFTMTT